MPAYTSQPDNYSCGAASVFNALVALGISPMYDDVKDKAGTTYRGGTSAGGIQRAIIAFGLSCTEYRTHNPDNAWKFVQRHCASSPLILLVDRARSRTGHWGQSHWLTVTGCINDRITIVDSGPPKKEGDEYGVSSYGRSELLERWQSKSGSYYAIRVSKM